MPDLSSELTNFLSQHLSPEELAATKVVTDAPARIHPHRITVYISYVQHRRLFVAHREGLAEVRAASIHELMARLTEQFPGVEFDLHLSKLARAEVARRKTGGPLAPMWY